MIIPASEMHETMDKVESNFVVDGLAMFAPLALGSIRADEDFPVMEGDDIGGRGIVEKIAMHARDVHIIDNGDLNFWQ